MTKSTITRERAQQIFLGNGPEQSASEERELARMALAAMDSEPVAYIFKHPAGRLFWSLTDESNKGHDNVMPDYASPQPAPVVPGKWIPVSERMPEDEQEVLTINKMGHRFVSFFDKHSGLFFDRLDAPAACCIEHVLVTHWMPLPAAPQEVKGE
ncbi:hypothetical protein AI2903V1_1833 [Klebsiella pneumoniae]|nr:hypothetical protein AI2903V1_1833 [Klebsiella pneumoniae]CAH5876198.1 hypothetical protein AI2903V1_1833 [Klebsiella pneumoniae]